jgi:hypothetical protein
MKRDLADRINRIADRQPLEQFSAASFGLLAREHSLPYDLEFDHAERSFDAQDQLVIQVIQVVDLLFVGNERPEDLAHLQQSTPVFIRAGQPRYVSAANDSDLSQCNRAENTLESFPTSGRHARTKPQVTIDNLHLLPAQHAHPLGHGVLQVLAFLILPDLFLAGLA